MLIANDLEFPLFIFKKRAFGWVVADTSLVRWCGNLVYPAQRHGEPAGPVPSTCIAKALDSDLVWTNWMLHISTK
jgi:hypothetical protein